MALGLEIDDLCQIVVIRVRKLSQEFMLGKRERVNARFIQIKPEKGGFTFHNILFLKKMVNGNGR